MKMKDCKQWSIQVSRIRVVALVLILILCIYVDVTIGDDSVVKNKKDPFILSLGLPLVEEDDNAHDENGTSRMLQTSSSSSWVTDKLIGIKCRLQWDCNFRDKNCCNENCNSAICDGYCGSASLQESLLYYGAYVSQGLIRRIVSFNDINSAQDILIDTDQPNTKPDFEITAELLGLDPHPWYALDKKKPGLRKFLTWATNEMKPPNYAPVAMGVVFQGSKEGIYDHIVTAIKGIRNGLWFYDHYRKKRRVVRLASMPAYNSPCCSVYCLSRKMYAVSLRKPPTVSNETLVRLKVIATSSGWKFLEPNWTCASQSPSILTLAAQVPYHIPSSATSGKKQYIAIVLETDQASVIRNTNNDPYGGSPVRCIEFPTDSTSESTQVTFDVNSNQAVYTKVLSEGEGCPM